jgi:hypothetical protein
VQEKARQLRRALKVQDEETWLRVPSEARTLAAQDPNAVKAGWGSAQLTRRVSSTSVTVITPGAGCSITSTATVSTAGAIGCFTFRATFFTDAGLGLALATVRFVAFALANLDTLRALPRLAALRSFARFCTFDAFLRLAMIAPLGAAQRYNGPSRSQLLNASYQQIAHLSAPALALFFLSRTGAATNGRLSLYYSPRGFSLA